MVFGRQAIRLLRDDWPRAKQLAEELFAILSNAKIPLEHAGPIVFFAGDGAGGITFRGFGDSNGTPITIEREDSSLPPITIGPSGIDLNGADILNGGTIEAKHLDGNAGGDSIAVGGGGIFLGTVLSGTGTTYLVDIDGTEVTAVQGTIHEDDEIPAGTEVMVFQIGADYFLNVPVWM